MARKALLVLALASGAGFINNYLLTSVFPYSAALVLHFNLVESVDEAGYYAGILAATFMIARTFSAFLWGQLSDDFGRRRIFLAVTLSSSIFPVMFGLSNSFAMALLSRFLMGFFGGHIGVAKTLVSESVDAHELSKNLGYLNGISNLGAIVSPSIGGSFSFSSKTDLIENKFEYLQKGLELFNIHLEKTPFLIPNLIAAIFSFIVFVLGFLALPETLPARPLFAKLNQDDTDDNNKDLREVEIPSGKLEKISVLKYVFPFDQMIAELKDPLKRIAAVLYVFYSGIHLSFMEVAPLWFQSSLWELSVEDVGWVLSISAVFLITYTMLIFPLFADKIESATMVLYGVNFLVLYFAILPQLVGMQQHKKEALVLLMSSFQIVNSSIFVAINAMVNNSSFPSERGAINGLVLCLGSMSKAAGPFVFAELFAWSNSSNHVFPLEHHLVFYLFAVISIGFRCFAKRIPKELNHPKPQPNR